MGKVFLLLTAALSLTVLLVLAWGGLTGDGPPVQGRGRTDGPGQRARADRGGASGEALFRDNCASCHGDNAAGREGIGPPLVHRIYEPGHHGDGAFLLAVRQGVRAHHWPFGNMPPVAGVGDKDVESITAYVRKLQTANGIN